MKILALIENLNENSKNVKKQQIEMFSINETGERFANTAGKSIFL